MKRVIGVAFIIIIVLSLAACGGIEPRAVLSAEEFTSLMTSAGHPVEDVTHFYDDIPGLEILLLADLGDFSVEFIVYDTEAPARALYNQLRSDLEYGRGRTSSHRETNVANFSRFIQTTDGRFEALTRVENTLVLIITSSENRGQAEAVLDILGY